MRVFVIEITLVLFYSSCYNPVSNILLIKGIFMKINYKIKAFTIVELLIVVVVIGIIASITIVSYSAVTNRSRTASLQATANNLLKKAETYKQNNATGAFAYNYPPTVATLTSLATNDASYLTGITSLNTTDPTASNTGTNNNAVQYQICGVNTAVPVTYSSTNPLYNSANPTAIASGAIITGIQVRYWDFASNNIATISSGKFTGNEGALAVNCVNAS